jgi:hypothetical protein
VNGYSRPVSNRVALSRSPYFFFLLSRSLLRYGPKKKKGFSSFAYVLVGDYMLVCKREQAKKAGVGGYCRQQDI